MKPKVRRDFLKFCGLAGLGVAAPISWVESCDRSQQNSESFYDGPYYVVINANGGWDTTYLMDPKGINEINRLYKQGEIQTAGNIKFAPTQKHIEKGMSNEDFFEKYSDELLVLNGIDYSVNNHSPCSRYMATGKLDSQAYPTFAALVAACQGPRCPIAFLTFGNYSATGNLVPMSRVSYLPSLKLLANADGVGGSETTRYHDDFVVERMESALNQQHLSRKETVQLPRRDRAQNMLYAAQVNSKDLERVSPFIPKNIPKERMAQQAEIALASFKAGVCVSANLTISQFDSHANNDRDQMNLIPEFLAGIDYLVRRSEELKIREKLVIIIQSEMGRRPVYNGGDGKDHWSIGSIMFMGNGIEGNRVLGATDEEQFLVPINPHSMELAPDDGVRVRPEHIHLALRQLAGIDRHESCKQFPLDVTKDEQLSGLWQTI